LKKLFSSRASRALYSPAHVFLISACTAIFLGQNAIAAQRIPDYPLGTPNFIAGVTYKAWFNTTGAGVIPTPPDPGATFGAPSAAGLVTTQPYITCSSASASPPRSASNVNFAIQWDSYFLASTSGTYTFNTTSDDGSLIYIGVGTVDQRLVVSNNYSQGETLRSGTVDLQAGYHKITVLYAQGGGGFSLDSQAQPPGGALTTIDIYLYQFAPPAVAVADSYVVPPGALFKRPAPGVLANDSDPQRLTAALDATTSHGTLALSNDGGFTYMPDAGFSGQDSFTYHALNSTNQSSSVVTVTINVENLSVASATPASGFVGQAIQNVSIAGTGFKTIPVPASAVSFNGHSYLYITTTMDWHAARDYCNGLGGHLVTIGSAAENTLIMGMIQASTWIGLSDEAVSGTFLWVNNEPLVYTNWGLGEPSLGIETFTIMRTDGTWNDTGPDTFGSVCEFDGMFTSVKLVRGAAEIDGTNIRVNSSFQLLADFNLPTNAAGTWDIVLTDPDTSATVTLANGFNIDKFTPLIVWPQPAAIVAGTPLSSAQLNAVAEDAATLLPISGTFAYSPDFGAKLGAGAGQSLTVTFTPNDTSNYNAVQATNAIQVNPAIPPAITNVLDISTPINTFLTFTLNASGTVPVTFGAANLPAGLALNGDTITGTPSASGVFDIALTATNYGGSVSKVLKLTVIAGGTNHAPTFASPPTASANPALVGTPVTFAAQAADADGDALEYTWDFGDGTTAVGASVSKSFAGAGVYIVTVTVFDGQAGTAQSVDLVVNAQTAQDSFAVSKVKLGFSFTKSNSDTLTFSGQIPVPPGFSPAGKSVRVLIGGFVNSATLNEKGASDDKTFALRSKKGSATASFSFTVKNRDLFVPLQSQGFTKTAPNPALDFPVIVVLDGTSHLSRITLAYTVKASRGTPQSGTGKK